MLALALGGFGIGTTEFVAMGLLPDIARDLGVSEPTAGHVISAYALGVVVGAPTIAVLASRVPRKGLLIGLMVAFAVGNAATVLAPSYTTLMAARFVAGLPHGAYFGVAALVAASLAGEGHRAKAVATVMMGLSIANVAGVPVATALGQHLGWEAAFVLVTAIAVVTVAALWRWVPPVPYRAGSPLSELGALRNVQVWLTLLVGIVGFGGMFAVYTYITTTLTDVAGLSLALVPLALMVYGLGMVVGNYFGGVIADRALMPGMFAMLGALVATLSLFTLTSQHPVTAVATVFLIGASGAALVPGLQTRLMDVAGDAQTLAATGNHAALNLANAGGALLGGVVISAGWGYTAPAAVGAVLAVAGMVILAGSAALERSTMAQRSS
jgi:DHA1 family inner membrane transport protein